MRVSGSGFSNPMTTVGDLIIGDTGGSPIRLAIGSPNDVLKVTAPNTIGWGAEAGGGDVSAAANFATDNVVIRSDGTSKGVQATGIVIDDTTNAMHPGTNDAGVLGTATLSWSDLFLASGAVINFNNGDVTLTHAANTLTMAGGDLALGANNLTMTGSLGATGARLTAGWFTDLTVTNAIAGSITGSAASVTNATFTTALTVNGGTLTLTANVANTSVLTIGAGAVSVSGTNTGDQTTISGNAGTATALQTARNIGGVSFNGTADITVATATGGFTVSGGNLALGANSLTMTGSIAATGARVTKVWATDIESTNMPTVGGTAILTSLTAPQFTTIELGHASDSTISRVSAGVLAVEGKNIALNGTSEVLTTGKIELGHASDTTLSRSAAGVLAVEGKNIALNGTSEVLTTGKIELGHASDTTLSRSAAGVLAVEGVVVLTVAGGTLTGVIDLGENAGLKYDAALSADGKYSGLVRAGTAGSALAFGDIVSFQASDSRWELADANVITAAQGDARGLLGVCVLAANADGDATTILIQGFVRADAAFPTFTLNGQVYLSETAGDVTQTQPTTTDAVIRVLGVATTTDEIYFNPSLDYITHT